MSAKEVIGVKTDILFVGKEMGPLVEISSQLDGATYAIAIAEAPRPFDYLLRHRSHQPAGVIVCLSGNENVADFRAVCSAYPESTLVFLADRFPPRPAVARVVDQYHGAILRATESPLAVVASLVALIFQRRVE
jgi:hypothetical protein